MKWYDLLLFIWMKKFNELDFHPGLMNRNVKGISSSECFTNIFSPVFSSILFVYRKVK